MGKPPLKEYLTELREINVTIGPGDIFQKNKNTAKGINSVNI
jgi:hypothetical protein